MVKTRSQHKKSQTLKKIYRARVKSSPCRGKVQTACRLKYGCKNTKKGTRKSYCRKTVNRHA